MSSFKSYENAISLYSNLFNEAPAKKKYMYLYPIKSAGIKYSEALKLGFKASKYMWKYCTEGERRKRKYEY